MAGFEPRSEGSLADADMSMSQTSGTSSLERMSVGPKVERVYVCVRRAVLLFLDPLHTSALLYTRSNKGAGCNFEIKFSIWSRLSWPSQTGTMNRFYENLCILKAQSQNLTRAVAVGWMKCTFPGRTLMLNMFYRTTAG